MSALSSLTDRDINIRYKQQRLLLLRHASRCQHAAGKCPVTSRCADMKELWEHVVECKDQVCTVRHCVSSRYILSHYRKCKSEDCACCGPVRTAIQRSKEKKREAIESADEEVSTKQDRDRGSRVEAENGRYHYQSPPKRQKVLQVPVTPGATTSNNAAVVSPCPPASSNARDFMPSLQANVKDACLQVLKGLQQHKHGWVFNKPVDPVDLDIPDYFDVIKNPMDFGTIEGKLTAGDYTSVQDFEADVNLTFYNALRYNSEGSEVCKMATEMQNKFNDEFQVCLGKELEKRNELVGSPLPFDVPL